MTAIVVISQVNSSELEAVIQGR